MKQSAVQLPDCEGAPLVGYVCDAIGGKISRVAADDNEGMQRALRDVNFDTMPAGWFIIVRKAPRS